MLYIENRILVIRDHRVLIDADLAELYGVSTKALNQAVKRNSSRFPQDFMFQLNSIEKQEVVTNCDHLRKMKFSHSLPFVFTEHGAIQAANVLASKQAIDMGIYVVRAFIRLRDLLTSNRELVLRLDEIQAKTDLLSSKHDSFEQETREQIKQILNVLRSLMQQPEAPKKRPIGFVTPEDEVTGGQDSHQAEG
ncbi:ORF6N domain-containing protein [Massilia sp. BJB1822]|nr:ORF6N domain-containing protein [Massilia sp. BJB1822]